MQAIKTVSGFIVQLPVKPLSMVLFLCLLTAAINTTSAQPQSGQTPSAADTQVLGEAVLTAITEIQALMTGDDGEVDLEAAKALLDTLYEAEFDTANTFEKATILNFYTNYHLSVEDYPGALQRFEQLAALSDVREDVRLRTLRSLGQLYAAEEQWQQSIDVYTQWLAAANNTDDTVVYRGLSYGHYQLEQWQAALDYWMAYFEMREPGDLERSDYAYLNGLYFTLERYEDALALTKEMILRFNEQTDWDNYIAINDLLEDATAADQ